MVTRKLDLKGPLTPEDKLRISKECARWSDIVTAFESFPAPKTQYYSGGELSETLWIFRGHQRTDYSLKPTIERAFGESAASWAVLERQALKEFRSKARMHLATSLLPPGDKILEWLALMRHYGVPTRLLDFTLSPYIALYFALRGRSQDEKSSAEVWAINAATLRHQASSISNCAGRKEMQHEAEKKGEPLAPAYASLDPSDFASDLDILIDEDAYWGRAIAQALEPSQIRTQCFNEKGFVAFASPPVESPRLSSQQGVFLFNGAEKLNFQDSLFAMMSDHADDWCRVFRISSAAVPEAEERLFQMNIHDLSLFPDIEGLAGFIRQKARLQWFPNESEQ
jgi:hypothetical protein